MSALASFANDDDDLSGPQAAASSPASSAASYNDFSPTQPPSSSKALGPLFMEGQQIVEKLDDMDSSSVEYEVALQTGLKSFQVCRSIDHHLVHTADEAQA